MTARNLVLLFDGTWNKARAGVDDDQTNVEKLYRLLPDSYVKNVHYEEGVGVKSEEEILGGAFGAGIDDRILGAYRFLQSRYTDPGFDNRLFIFGFSRGAYTARTFAQLLHYSGLPAPQASCQKAWDCYYKQDAKAAAKFRQSGASSDVSIEMLGVWDTVKSTLDANRKDKTLYPNVRAAYHAMAIDEKRRNFPLLRFNGDERVRQVWFAGVHSDIGGGYPGKEAGLSDITLDWMVTAARGHGLEFVANVQDYVVADAKAGIHDSYVGYWRALGSRKRRIGKDELVHSSVKTRLAAVPEYRPTNLPAQPRYV